MLLLLVVKLLLEKQLLLLLLMKKLLLLLFVEWRRNGYNVRLIESRPLPEVGVPFRRSGTAVAREHLLLLLLRIDCAHVMQLCRRRRLGLLLG